MCTRARQTTRALNPGSYLSSGSSSFVTRKRHRIPDGLDNQGTAPPAGQASEQLWVTWDVWSTAVGLGRLWGRSEDGEVGGRLGGRGVVVGVAFDGEEGDEGVDVLREEADLPAAEAQVRDAAAAGLLADPPR